MTDHVSLERFTGNSLFFPSITFGIELYAVQCIKPTYHSPYNSKGVKKLHTRFAASVPVTVTVSDDMLKFTDQKTIKILNINDHR